MPAAMVAAFRPATPPPITTTRAGATPGTPPGSTPRPPDGFISAYAPTWGASLPATSDIGASSGSAPFAVWTVSYAIAVVPASSSALVSASSAARCR